MHNYLESLECIWPLVRVFVIELSGISQFIINEVDFLFKINEPDLFPKSI